MKPIRVFPRKTKATPTDEYAFVGDPVLFRPEAETVLVSCAFTWDKPEAERLADSWARYYDDVRVGGPAYDDAGDWFMPGMFIKPGYTITSRGCDRQCDFCYVPRREGRVRELPIAEGHDVVDNNILSCSKQHIENVFAMLRARKRTVRFSGGLYNWRVGDWFVGLLQTVPLPQSRPGVFVAYDKPRDARETERAISLLRDSGLRQRAVGCYVLVGYDGDTMRAAEDRLHEVWAWGAMPFAMLYRDDTGETTQEWRKFQRGWCRPAAIISRMTVADN